jgi:2',3'-cyclic-nucleotide 2'-phosphodiesterase (5'-nucleotidase family)
MKVDFRNAVLAGLLVGVSGCGLARLGQATPRAAPIAEHQVTLLFTGDSRGAVEPVKECACYDKPAPALGGLGRRAAYVRQVRAAGDGVLLLDAGDTVADPDEAQPDPGERLRVARAIGAMAYDAVAPGRAEIRGAATAADGWVAALGAPLLAANLRGADALPRQPVVIKEAAGARVAVLGAVGTSAIPPPLQADLGVSVDPPAAALRSHVASARSSADLVVVLFHGTFDEARELASGLEGVDVVVAAQRAGLPHGTVQAGRALVVEALPDGKHVGHLRLAVRGRGQVATVADDRVTLDETYPEDPAVAGLLGTGR